LYLCKMMLMDSVAVIMHVGSHGAKVATATLYDSHGMIATIATADIIGAW
jgi:hypothetical protein